GDAGVADLVDQCPGVAAGAGGEAGDPDGAGAGAAQAPQAFDGGGLAGAVGAEDPEDLALVNGEADVVHGAAAAVGLAQPADFDDRHGSRIAAGGGRAHRPGRSSRHQPSGGCGGTTFGP